MTSALPPSAPKSDSDRGQPSAAHAREQFERILASPFFRANTQRRTLFRFLVEEALGGRADRLKGFTIAVAVFGRDETFDAQADPVVRLEARRLRRDLDGYYANAGSRDPIRISIPKGAYAPLFERQEPQRLSSPPLQPSSDLETGVDAVADSAIPVTRHATAAAVLPPTTAQVAGAVSGEATGRRSHLPVFPLLLSITILIAAVGAWLWNQRLHQNSESATALPQERGPSVIVLPFEPLSAHEDDRFFASGITYQLITDLMRLADFKLYSVPASLRQNAAADPADVGRSLAVAYVIKGSVRSDARHVRVGAQLVDAKTGQVLWSETYDRELTPDKLLGVQEDLAAELATRLAHPYGEIPKAVTTRFHKERPQTLFAYECILQAYTYRSTFSRELYAPTRACLEQAVRLDPAYADAFALLGWLHLDAARYRFVPEGEAAGEMEQARIFAERAVTLAPKHPVSLQALAAVSYYRGEFDKAERLQRDALALNPHDPETAAQLGWRLAFRGRWEEGLGYLRQAIARSLSPPAWYYTSLAMHAYLRGNYAEALVEAEQTRITFSGIGLALYAMTQAALGNQDEAKKALDEMAARVPHFASDPAGALRIHHIDEPIIDRLVDGLRKAGWKEPVAPRTAAGPG